MPPTKPDPEAYREALVASREVVQDLREEQVHAIVEALENFADGLEEAYRGEFAGVTAAGLDNEAALQRSEEIVRSQAEAMLEVLVRSTEQNRTAGFDRVLQVWGDTAEQIAESNDIDLAEFGGLRSSPVTLMGQYEAVGAAQNWRTLLRGHVEDAAAEANRIIRNGMAEGVHPTELSRRLRRYVEGSEELDELFEEVETVSGEVQKIDLRQDIPDDLQGAARQMQFNADRIAASEIQNARIEAEIQHAGRDPMVEGKKWRTSPRHSDVDECDVLASQDLYGLGPGVYPVFRTPPPPHPFCLCETTTTTRPPSEFGEPKPHPTLQQDPEQVAIPGGSDLTDARERRIRQQVGRALEEGNRMFGELEDQIGGLIAT